MRIIPAALALCAGIAVGSCFADWSAQANKEACAIALKESQAPSPAASDQSARAQFDAFLLNNPMPCQQELSSEQKQNVIVGGILIAFITYAFLLATGKIFRWLER